MALISYVFYKSLPAMIVVSPIGAYIWKELKRSECEKRQELLANQFKDCIKSVSNSMKAGYSAENAFKESINDVKLIHGEDALMVRELEGMTNGLLNNVTLEEELISLGKRSGVDDIREFGEIFAIAKRGGGNLTGVIADTVSIMNKKIETDKEIKVLISSRKMESTIMAIVPFAIVLYISVTSPGFFESLYHNVLGIIIMSICLGVYMCAVIMTRKIVNIEV